MDVPSGKDSIAKDAAAKDAAVKDVSVSTDSSKWHDEEFYKIFNLSPIVMSIGSLKDGKFLEINKYFELATGFSRDEVLGRTVPDLGIFENLSEYEKFFQSLVDGKNVKDLEIRSRVKNGEVRTAIISSDIMYFNGERCALSAIEDITERKKTEELLYKETEKAKIYLNIIPAMILVLDINGNITLINQKGCDILECDRDSIIGKNWFYTFLPETVWESVRGKFRQMLFGNMEQAEYSENVVLTYKKNVRHIRWHNALLYDTNKKIIGTISAGEDITDRKNADAILKKSEEKFSKAFNSSPAIMIILSLKDKKFMEVNEAWEQRTGYKREDVIGQTISGVLLAESREMSKNIDKLAEEGSVHKSEIKLRTKNSQLMTGLLSAEKFEFNGEMCALTVIEDITERKKAEQALKDRTEELEKFNKLTIGRELRMVELKERIKELEEKLIELKKARM